MATTYDKYPTPPPTGSPKGNEGSSYRASSSRPAQETYYNPTTPNRPAQDTYFPQTTKTSYSAPGSPTAVHSRWNPPPPSASQVITVGPQPQPGQYDYLPPRRKSSPIQSSSEQKPYPHDSYFDPSSSSSTIQKPYVDPTASSSTIRPLRRKSSPRVSPNTSPRPLHFSPANPIPTPYNASRPQPRPGLVARMLLKLKSWARGFIRWSRNNPIKAGLLTVVPVLAGAAVYKAMTTVAKVIGVAGIAIMEGMGGGRTPGNWKGAKDELKSNWKEAKENAKVAAKEDAAEWGYGLDDFKGFGGSKGGPVEGFLKVMQMMVNHLCKLSTSPVPRAASILLELYFIERLKN